jgi:hypothetical protein
MEISDLGGVVLAIPAWQVGFFIALISIFMLNKSHRLSLITTYLFTLYWGFVVYGQEFVQTAQSSPLVLSVYIICGMAHVILTLVAFFQQD